MIAVSHRWAEYTITTSSTANLVGFEFGTAYAASKFGLEGWMRSLQFKVALFSITAIIRTELLAAESTNVEVAGNVAEPMSCGSWSGAL